MAIAHYISLEQKIPGLNTAMGGQALALADMKEQGGTYTLSEIAKNLGVTPLSDFFSESPAEILLLLGADPQNPPEETTAQLLPEEWYAPADGLATIQSLIPYLKQYPDAVPNSAAVVQDLAIAERILTTAQEKNVRWNLKVDGVNEVENTH